MKTVKEESHMRNAANHLGRSAGYVIAIPLVPIATQVVAAGLTMVCIYNAGYHATGAIKETYKAVKANKTIQDITQTTKAGLKGVRQGFKEKLSEIKNPLRKKEQQA